MTENQFKLCCNLLHTTYKGKKLRDIVQSSEKFIDIEIDNIIYDRNRIGKKVRFRNNERSASIIYFSEQKLKINGNFCVGEYNYDYVEDFLKFVKIPLEDIV